MYAIIETGGKQYMVNEGDILQVERLNVEEGNTLEITDILAISSDGSISTGDENASAKVTAKVLRHGKGKKVIVFKYKPKKDYRRKQGHRQPFTEIQIESISK